MFSVNIIAVIVSLVAYTLLGMLWYGPLLGKKWAVLAGLDGEDMNSPEMKKAQTTGYISSLISSAVALYTLAVALRAMGVDGGVNGLLTGAGLGFGLVSMALVGEAAWHETPWGLVAINSGYRVLGLAVGGLIIGLW